MDIRVVIVKKKIYIKIVDADSDRETINVFAYHQRDSFYFHDIHIRNSDFDVRIVENVRISIDNFYNILVVRVIRNNRLDYHDYIYYILISQILYAFPNCFRTLSLWSWPSFLVIDLNKISKSLKRNTHDINMKVSCDKRSNTLVRNTTKQNRARRENIIAQEGSGCTKLFETTNY